MIKKIAKKIYKNSAFFRKVVNYAYTPLQESYFKFKDVIALKGEKLRLISKVNPYTMVGYLRLSNNFELATDLVKKNIKGDFVECGVWNGGSAAVLAYVASGDKKNLRKTWLLDSFEGLPEPTRVDGSFASLYANNSVSGELKPINQCVGSESTVRELFFKKLGFKKEYICIIKGWFQNSLPKMSKEIKEIALLRLDGDWYDSTRVCLEYLFPKVSKNGYVIIDDYGCWEGCKKAVDDFLSENNLNPVLHKIDSTGVYFQKI